MPKREHQLLLSHAATEAYAPMTRLLLAKLGYLILSPEELASIEGAEALRPVLLLLDESQVSSATAVDRAVPILMVTSQEEGPDALEADPRVAGVVRCRQDGRAWNGVLASISEKGCLLARPDLPELGSWIELSFELPESGGIKLTAECAYHDLKGAGLVFREPSPSIRAVIARFVRERLLD